jgi:exodeoxyribonuclease-3
MSVKILCWNANGIRSVYKKGFLEWLYKESPQILCIEETKAKPEQLGNDLREPEGYLVYWNWAVKKGYSGVVTFSKEEPLRNQYGFGVNRFDSEGRVIVTEYSDFSLFNVYFPNGKASKERISMRHSSILSILCSGKIKGW